MDWMQFTAEMTRALVWPACLLICILIFRRHLIALLQSLKRVKVGDTEWVFDLAKVVLGGADQPLDEGTKLAIMSAVHALSNVERLALIFRYHEEMTDREIAATLDITEEGVNMIIDGALAKIRAFPAIMSSAEKATWVEKARKKK